MCYGGKCALILIIHSFVLPCLQWTDIQGIHSRDYYEKVFNDLIEYLNKQIYITVMY